MAPIRLMLLWHMHQPYYKDLVENRYAMPWVRLHTLKDYYGMVAMIEEFPTVHMTFNLVPSLIVQIQDYASGAAREESLELAFRPARDLTPAERERLVKYAFQVNFENLLNRYPRFQELFEKSRGADGEPAASRIAGLQEILDLQVLSQLAWFDEIYLASDPEINALVARGRDYTEQDKEVLRAKEAEIFQQTLEVYRKASERGQIEISTSPFYHPILPLLCDTYIAQESSPGIHLPSQRFRHPEDARAQLREAVALHEKTFGRRPRGLWPSEGSVSEEALRIAAEEGFIWAATDEGILGRSMHTYFHRHNDGTVQDGRLLYQPHRYKAGSQSIDLFFRDHQLSDLIGFVYSRMDPETAAHDLIHRIRMAARSAGDQASVVTIILDGENAWEYYPGNGREFLKRFYGLLASAPDIQALTPSEILATTPPNPLPRLMPGSWINANFNVWIGADEDNKAWDLLSDARNFFAKQSSRPDLNSDRIALARQELWIAEGSDWCWWYGPEHSTANDEEFDHLFRKHLSNIYRLLQGETPIELAAPIKRPRVGGYNIFPTALISPAIDGRETTYFEWLGAGIYLPDYRSGSIHQSGQFIKELHYGYDESALYLRVDLKSEFARKQHDFEIRVSIDGENHSRLQATISRDTLTRVEFWDGDQKLQYPSEVRNQVQVAYEHIFELRLNYSILHLDSPQRIALQVSFWVNQLPVQTVPREGWLSLELTKELVVW
jgi:alpha-amylase/alpha-mannosidase (GH57 family)